MTDARAINWLNRLGKWRSVLAGWQLGTRVKGDPEGDAVRDHREATLMLRAEVNAFTQLLIARGVFTTDEFEAQLASEAQLLCQAYEKRFPGFRAEDFGMHMDVAQVTETTRGWRR